MRTRLVTNKPRGTVRSEYQPLNKASSYSIIICFNDSFEIDVPDNGLLSENAPNDNLQEPDAHTSKDNYGRRSLETVYPDHHWNTRTFAPIEKIYWTVEKQRLFFDEHLKEKLEITTLNDWYQHTVKEALDHGGRGILYYYNNSLQRALETIYPEYQWNTPNFERVPDGYWDTIENQRLFFNSDLKDKLQIAAFQDFYQHSTKEIHDHGGTRILFGYYDGSLQRALETIYPEYQWHFEPRQKRDPGYWQTIENHRSFFDTSLNEEQQYYGGSNATAAYRDAGYWHYIPEHLRRLPEFWNRLREMKLREGHCELTQDYISILYPEYTFARLDPVTMIPHVLSQGERDVFMHLDSLKIANDWQIHFLHPELIHSASGKHMELDFFSPSLQLAIEYQGRHHYEQGFKSNEPFEEQQMRDEEKRIRCKEMGIHLLEIDCRSWKNWGPSIKHKKLISGIKRIGKRVTQEGDVKKAWQGVLSNLEDVLDK